MGEQLKPNMGYVHSSVANEDGSYTHTFTDPCYWDFEPEKMTEEELKAWVDFIKHTYALFNKPHEKVEEEESR
jgi:hypothetical protein